MSQRVSFKAVSDIPAGTQITIQIGDGAPEPTPKPKPKPEPEPEPDPGPEPEPPSTKRMWRLATNRELGFERIDFPSLVFAGNQWNIYFLATRDGRRSLYKLEDRPVLIRENVQHVQAWQMDGKVFLAIVTDHPYTVLVGSDHLPFLDFEFRPPDPINVEPYQHGDALSVDRFIPPIQKANEFVRRAGKAVDYRRHWFRSTGPMLEFPLGTHEEVYTIARNRIGATQVAIVGLFTITDAIRTDDQHGPITPVWATSLDGVRWDFPLGRQPAFLAGNVPGFADDDWKMTLPNKLQFYGPKELHCTFGALNFEHNRYRETADPVTAAGVAVFDVNAVRAALEI